MMKQARFGASVKPVDAASIDGVLSRQIGDLKSQFTHHGYDAKSLTERFDARPLGRSKLLRGKLDPTRTRELTDETRAAGRPL